MLTMLPRSTTRRADSSPEPRGVKIDDGFLVLNDDAMRLTLDACRGGAIRELERDGRAIFRPTPATAGEDPFDTACFAMAPYVNRIAHGRFSFAGQAVRVARNWSEDPHPLHGHGWRARWLVVASSSWSATLQFEGGADEWPWRYRCRQRFELAADGLSVELSIANLSDTPMPTMLGLHPYFPQAAQAQLQARLPKVWMTDQAALPVQEAPTPASWDFTASRAINAVPLDHCFSGWDGNATLRWPDRTVLVHAAHCEHLQIYAPAGQDFFCIEPQSARSGALGGDGAGMRVVAPGERFAIGVRFTVQGA
jgi:aldose 1-epimerase